jgi:hypothetical protein
MTFPLLNVSVCVAENKKPVPPGAGLLHGSVQCSCHGHASADRKQTENYRAPYLHMIVKKVINMRHGLPPRMIG